METLGVPLINQMISHSHLDRSQVYGNKSSCVILVLTHYFGDSSHRRCHISTKESLRSSQSLPRDCALDSSVDFPQLIPRMLRRYFPSEVYPESSNSQPVAHSSWKTNQKSYKKKRKTLYYIFTEQNKTKLLFQKTQVHRK